MARCSIRSLMALACLLPLGLTLVLPVSGPSIVPGLAPDSSDEWTWYWLSGDGSQIIPIGSLQETPKNLTAANGHSYKFGFGNFHGTAFPQPRFAKFLFDCEFGLFDLVPASGLGVWTPSPQGKYVCNGNLPGSIRMNLVENNVGWKMAYHDIAFVIKVLHDTQGVKEETPFFDFEFHYTDEVESRPYDKVLVGEWVKTHGDLPGKSQ